jgi:pyridoxal phosphate enzyme (YggS family)
MAVNAEKYREILAELDGKAQLVAVSKTKPVKDIMALYELGQRDFGENYVQELVDKRGALPADIRWHFIGHLQSNKVRSIAPFVFLIHGVDSVKLLREVNKQAIKAGRNIDCLLQVHIAKEETKFGFDATELPAALAEVGGEALNAVTVRGLMGMASLDQDKERVEAEFRALKGMFDASFGKSGFMAPGEPGQKAPLLSMGMSDDYQVAIREGSNMVRIGSLLFGKREAKNGGHADAE